MEPPSELTDLLAHLIQIDSVNPDLTPGGAGEGVIADFVAAWLQDAGLDVTLQEAAPGRPNVIAIARGSGGGPSLMLNAHLDTVGVSEMSDPFTPRIEDGRMYGRGAYDMKGSLAAMMLAVKSAAAQSLSGDVIITAVIDEEYASIGTQCLLDAYRADAAIVTEPTELDVCIAHKGFIWLEVETVGKAAHGSRPQLGIDAITKMGPVLVGLDALDRRLQAAPSHPLLHNGTLHASLISGGQELSAYPAHCRLSVERRTIPGESPQQVTAQIQTILDEAAAHDPDFKAALRTTLIRDPFGIDPDAPIVRTVAQSVEKIQGVAPALIGMPFWMDAALFVAAGIPAVVFGPHGEGAHAAVEWVDLASVQTCYEVLLATILDFCA